MRRLIVRPGAIGDCILSLPALECLRAEATEVWVAAQNVPLVRTFDAVHSIASTGIDLLGLPDRPPPATLIARLRGFDSIVSWYGAGRAEFRAEVARLGLPFTFFDALPPEVPGVHAADFFLAQARTVSSRSCGAVPRIACPRQGGGFTAIHPLSGSPRKNWPLENFRRLAAIVEPCQWCAGPEEQLDGAVRFDDLYDLACWLASARLYIGNDSGITHLAAAVGTPVIALFGPTDPVVWAPRGPNVQVVHLQGDYFPNPIPLNITPSTRWSPAGEKVLSTVNAALAAGPLGSTGGDDRV
ncbi:MAG: glycosyltransferase family 9 protein [Acidobacteria bacterium]|nr:glycosyltransferase family 9 protein [Acidobacteriota bacterium]